MVTRIAEHNEIEVPSVGDRPSRMMRQRDLGEILEPRARELMELLRDNLRHAGVLDMLGGGIVLTGGERDSSASPKAARTYCGVPRASAFPWAWRSFRWIAGARICGCNWNGFLHPASARAEEQGRCRIRRTTAGALCPWIHELEVQVSKFQSFKVKNNSIDNSKPAVR